MREIADYLALIASQHRGKPRFEATVTLCVAPFIEVQRFLGDLPAAFDIDLAVGVQLDIVGQWVGRTRYVEHPLPTLYFSFDDPSRGFDQGVWFEGVEDVQVGVARLDDEPYRRLLRAKIAANTWDGTFDTITPAYDAFFASEGTHVFVEDHQDMTMTVCVAGRMPDLTDLAIVDAGYVPLKPEGVSSDTIVTSADDAPIFGFDLDNEFIGGFDDGAWGVTPDYLINNTVP